MHHRQDSRFVLICQLVALRSAQSRLTDTCTVCLLACSAFALQVGLGGASLVRAASSPRGARCSLFLLSYAALRTAKNRARRARPVLGCNATIARRGSPRRDRVLKPHKNTMQHCTALHCLHCTSRRHHCCRGTCRRSPRRTPPSMLENE